MSHSSLGLSVIYSRCQSCKLCNYQYLRYSINIIWAFQCFISPRQPPGGNHLSKVVKMPGKNVNIVKYPLGLLLANFHKFTPISNYFYLEILTVSVFNVQIYSVSYSFYLCNKSGLLFWKLSRKTVPKLFVETRNYTNF